MLHLKQFRELIVRPALQAMDRHSQASENLVVGTHLVESVVPVGGELVVCFHQLGSGPALGPFQMEPATFNWLWDDWLPGKPEQAKIASLAPANPTSRDLIHCWQFAAAMCRLRYWVDKQPLPTADDVHGLANYWKRVYNTSAGAGDPAEFVRRYRRWAM